MRLFYALLTYQTICCTAPVFTRSHLPPGECIQPVPNCHTGHADGVSLKGEHEGSNFSCCAVIGGNWII